MSAELVTELRDEAEKMWQERLATKATHNRTVLLQRLKLIRRAADALAARGDTVPLAQDLLAAHFEEDRKLIRRRRDERDEARAERDALAAREAQVRKWRDDDLGWGSPLDGILDTAPVVSLALHDAEVWDEGNQAASDDFDDIASGRAPVPTPNPYRAAAIREAAN